MTAWRPILGSLLAAVLFFVGCGPSRPQTIPVTGRVTFAGQPPPAAGTLFFACTQPAEGYIARPAMGEFDARGVLQVAAFEDVAGLVPGKYEVRVECWKTPPTEAAPGVSHLPEGFGPVPFEVPADAAGAVELVIDVR